MQGSETQPSEPTSSIRFLALGVGKLRCHPWYEVVISDREDVCGLEHTDDEVSDERHGCNTERGP